MKHNHTVYIEGCQDCFQALVDIAKALKEEYPNLGNGKAQEETNQFINSALKGLN